MIQVNLEFSDTSNLLVNIMSLTRNAIKVSEDITEDRDNDITYEDRYSLGIQLDLINKLENKLFEELEKK
ncbi:MAG: hypothetical protein IPH62_16390 [Ignavibacteriae bacterium]|nr:hypothetical protein [Ignavibacteriota bacterium]